MCNKGIDTSWRLISLLICFIMEVHTETKTYKVEDSCLFNGMSFSVDKGDEYELTYTGNSYLAYTECVYKFWPSNNGSKLCIKAYSFDIYNCNFRVTYEGGSMNLRQYKCQDIPSDYCDPEDGKPLTIKFKNGNRFKNVRDDIKLKIAIEEELNWIILVAVLSGLATIGIASFVTLVICIRLKKKPEGENISPLPQSLSTFTTTSLRQEPQVQTESNSTHGMSTQYSPAAPSADQSYEKDGIHKLHPVPNEYSSKHSHLEASAPPLVPYTPPYNNEPPPSYNEAITKT